MFTFTEALESEEWVSSQHEIPIILGRDTNNHIILADLAQMPHCLVAGNTGSGKSNCLHAFILSILSRFEPKEACLVLIDPQLVELNIYNTAPHLVMPVITKSSQAILALRWLIQKIDERF